MPSDSFADVVLRYSLLRQRAERGITRDVLRDLNDLKDAIKAVLATLGPLDGPLKAVRLRQLLTEIDRLIRDTDAKLRDTLTTGLVDLGQTDSDILGGHLGEITDTELDGPSAATIAAIAGGGLALFLSRSLARLKRELYASLAIDTPETVDAALIAIDTAFESSAVDLARLSDTASSKMLNDVSATLYGEAGITDWHWDATLDASTCLLCAVKDGTLLGPDDPRPPAHIHCRCVIVPVIPGEERPAFESPGHYEQWLERQPEAVQREIVGPTRYKLFLADRKKSGFQQGGLPLSLAVSDNRIIPVARLKQDWAALLALQEKAERRAG